MVTHDGLLSASTARHSRSVTTKQRILEAIRELPEETSYEDAIYRLYVLQKVERGIEQADRGETEPHEEVMKLVERWLKGLAGQSPTWPKSPLSALSTPLARRESSPTA